MIRQKDSVTAGILIAVLTAVACTTTESAAAKSDSASHWGKRKGISFEQLQADFAEPDMIYAPFTFWFWDEPIRADKAAAAGGSSNRSISSRPPTPPPRGG